MELKRRKIMPSVFNQFLQKVKSRQLVQAFTQMTGLEILSLLPWDEKVSLGLPGWALSWGFSSPIPLSLENVVQTASCSMT